jgi:hypothetical protein
MLLCKYVELAFGSKRLVEGLVDLSGAVRVGVVVIGDDSGGGVIGEGVGDRWIRVSVWLMVIVSVVGVLCDHGSMLAAGERDGGVEVGSGDVLLA